MSERLLIDVGVTQASVEVFKMFNREWIRRERSRKAKYRKLMLWNLETRKLDRFCAQWVKMHIESSKDVVFRFENPIKQAI